MNHDDRQPDRRIRDPRELAAVARRLRRRVIELVAPTGQGYVQQGLGAADLFATLYFGELRLDPSDMDWRGRDRVLLSTAHNTAILYATLAERGLVQPNAIADYCKDGSPFEINASERVGTVVEATCGSLAQGLSVGIGMAISARRQGLATRVYVILGDGELQEGQVWEAALLAGSLGLDNLCLLIDDNRMQVEGDVETVVKLAPIDRKWDAFGWAVQTVAGHDPGGLLDAFDRARGETGRPSCLVVQTLPGKGVPALEGILAHNLKLPPDIAAAALASLAE